MLTFVAIPVETPPQRLRVVEPHPPAAAANESLDISHERVARHAARHVAFLIATAPDDLGVLDDQWRRAAREHVPTVFRDLTSGDSPC